LAAPSQEDHVRRLLMELRLMQGSAETLEQRLGVLQTAVADLRLASSSLNALKDLEEGAHILVPTGGGTFANATLGDLRKVIIGVGADVSVEMELEDAIGDVLGRLEDMEKASQSVRQQLEQILAQMQSHQEVLNRLGAQLQGESPGV
jgi:prefoldin alpha subunit